MELAAQVLGQGVVAAGSCERPETVIRVQDARDREYIAKHQYQACREVRAYQRASCTVN
jgi:hypothetical protein